LVAVGELVVPREADSEFLGNPDEHSIAMLHSDLGNNNAVLSRFTRDDMKKTKRLSIEYRHREVTITVEGSTLRVEDSKRDAANAPEACPACGSPWITLVAPMGGDVSADDDNIRRALQQSGLHLQVSPTGQLRICQRSFEELKEKF
jgi:hypothetical protein